MNIILNYIMDYEQCTREEAYEFYKELKWSIERAESREEAQSYLEEYNIPADLVELFNYGQY